MTVMAGASVHTYLQIYVVIMELYFVPKPVLYLIKRGGLCVTMQFGVDPKNGT